MAMCVLAGATALACEAPSASHNFIVKNGQVQIPTRVAGQGTPVVFVPSIGRSVEDFDDLAARMAAAGYIAIQPTPRGIRSNLSALAMSDLNDLADDVLAVARGLCPSEPAVIIGQAYGSRVARLAAARAPAQVTQLVLIGADDGQPVSDDLRAAMSNAVAQGIRSDTSRLEGLKTAFFAPGNDPTVWLDGWYPLVAAAQNRAGKRVDPSRWIAGGVGPVLLVQGANDPVQTPQAGEALAARMGERAQLVILPQASHALLPEQPEALAAVIMAFLKGENAQDPALIAPLLRNRQGKFADCRNGTAPAPGESCATEMETSPPRS